MKNKIPEDAHILIILFIVVFAIAIIVYCFPYPSVHTNQFNKGATTTPTSEATPDDSSLGLMMFGGMMSSMSSPNLYRSPSEENSTLNSKSDSDYSGEESLGNSFGSEE